MKATLLTGLLAAGLTGCGAWESVRAPRDADTVLKVSVLQSGKILANGNAVSIQDLDALLAANAETNGVVWYYREAGQQHPPPQAMQVLQLVSKHRRPISMSSQPDFSDTIDERGNSRPRRR